MRTRVRPGKKSSAAELAPAGRAILGVRLREDGRVGRGVLDELARALDVTPRTLRNWKRQAARVGPVRPPWRPARFDADSDELVARVEDAWRGQGTSSGERVVFEALGCEVPLRLVRCILRKLKAEHRVRARERIESERVHVEVLARDAVWCLDATHLGRDGNGEVQGEVLKDACSSSLLMVSVGRPSTSAELIEALQPTYEARGTWPLVLMTDNGAVYCSEAFEAFLVQNGIVHLRNEPHTPQHNAVAERAHGEIKSETGLGKGSRLENLPCGRSTIVEGHQGAQDGIADPSQCPVWVEDAGAARTKAISEEHYPRWWRDVRDCVHRLNHTRLRATRGYRTAAELDRTRPRAETLVSREDFLRVARFTIDLAVHDASNARARRRARREAIYCTLETFGLVTRTRGGVPWTAQKAESET